MMWFDSELVIWIQKTIKIFFIQQCYDFQIKTKKKSEFKINCSNSFGCARSHNQMNLYNSFLNSKNISNPNSDTIWFLILITSQPLSHHSSNFFEKILLKIIFYILYFFVWFVWGLRGWLDPKELLMSNNVYSVFYTKHEQYILTCGGTYNFVDFITCE